MTSATPDPTPAPMTGDRSPLEGIIRDLYAIVAFYLANPGHPLPTSITLSHKVADESAVDAVAEVYSGGHTYGDVAQAHHDLISTNIPVTLLISEPHPHADRPL
jgi:hypothetical protein